MDKHTIDLIAPVELTEEDLLALEDLREYELECKEARRIDSYKFNLKHEKNHSMGVNLD